MINSVCFGQVEFKLFSNYETISVQFEGVNDPEEDLLLQIYAAHITEDYDTAFYASKVYGFPGLYSGTVFHCETSQEYKVKVVFTDPTTPSLDGKMYSGTIKTRSINLNPSFKRTRYVSPFGSGSSYTIGEPGNLRKAISQLEAGDHIVLLNGSYFIGDLRLPVTGSEAEPIKFSSPSGKAILDGRDTAQLNWIKQGNAGLYYTTTSTTNPNLVLKDGLRLYPYRTLSELLRDKVEVGYASDLSVVSFDGNMDGFYRNPSTNPMCNPNYLNPRLLYIKLQDSSSPAEHDIVVSSKRLCMVLDNVKHYLFDGLTFQNYGRSPNGTAVRLSNSSDITFHNCTFKTNDIGISLGQKSDRVSIIQCQFSDSMYHMSAWTMKASYDLTLPHTCEYPYLDRMLERGAIIFEHGYSGRGLVVMNSKFRDFAQAGHACPPSINTAFKGTYDIDYIGNTFERCFEDGIEIDADARNIRITDNSFFKINAPVSLASAQGGPTYLLRNTFAEMVADTFLIVPEDGLKYIDGHPFKTQYGSPVYSGNIFFYHNTISGKNNSYGIDLFSPSRWHSMDIKNNIITSENGPLFSYTTSTYLPTNCENNLFYCYGQASFIIDTNYTDAMSKENFNHFGDFQNSQTWIRSNQYGDPQFFNRDQRMLYTYNGPSIDAAMKIPGINSNALSTYWGAGPDIGAYESKSGSIENPSLNDMIRFHPNPNSGTFWIESDLEGYNFQITDQLGRLIKNGLLSSREEVSLVRQPAGIYFLTVYHEFGRSSFKLMKI